MKSDQLDSAIDEVARQMTEAHPAGAIDFRRRVLARLESGMDHTAAPPRRWSAALVMSALAVAAALVIGIAVFRGGSSKSVSQVSVAPATEIPVAQAFRPAVAVTATPVAQALTAAAAELAPSTGAVRTTRAVRPSAIDALAPSSIDLQPLGVAPLDVAAVAPADSIRVVELEAISPIAVAPLGTEDSPRRFP